MEITSYPKSELALMYFPKVVEQVLNATFPEGSDSL